MEYLLTAQCDKMLLKDWIDQFLIYPTWKSLLYPVHYIVGTPEKHESRYIQTTEELLVSDYYGAKFSNEENDVGFINISSVHGISARINSTGINLPNTGIHLKFKTSHFEQGIVSYELLKQFIQSYLNLYPDWYYIAVIDKVTTQHYSPRKIYITKSSDLRARHYVMQLAWVTYYSYDLIELMGKERFDNLKTYEEKIELEHGLLITLQRERFDWYNPEHRARLEHAYQELGLDDFRHD